jgi:DNA-binding LacI/PurR family transcriptional regulator
MPSARAGWPSYELTTIRQPIAQMVDTTAEVLGLDTTINKKPAHKIRFLEGMLIERKTVMNRLRGSRIA